MTELIKINRITYWNYRKVSIIIIVLIVLDFKQNLKLNIQNIVSE